MKTRSNRYIRVKGSFTENTPFRLDPVSIILWVISMFVYGGLYGRTVDDEPFLTPYVTIFMIFQLVGLTGGMMFLAWQHFKNENRFGIYIVDLREFDFNKIMAFGVAFIGVFAVNIATSKIDALTSIEMFLFYVFAGVAEEFFFRFFIATTIYMLVHELLNVANTHREVIAASTTVITSTIISVFMSAISFYYAHFTRYGGQEWVLLGVFLSAVIFTTLYLYTKSLFAPMIIHMLVNFSYAAFVYFGSFTAI